MSAGLQFLLLSSFELAGKNLRTSHYPLQLHHVRREAKKKDIILNAPTH